MAVKKATTAVQKKVTGHPTWQDMIKECIAAHPEASRQGVSRPQIKKYVEEKYNLEIGAAQNSQLAKALSAGKAKGTFVLPKGDNTSRFSTLKAKVEQGPSGRVKLGPKAKSPETSSKENKPASKVKPVSKTKPATKPSVKAAASKATATTAKTSTKSTGKPTSKGAASKSKSVASTTVKKPVGKAKSTAAPSKKPIVAPKKVVAGKPKVAPAKKPAAKRTSAKQAVTGTTATAKAKAAAKKSSAKVTSTKAKAKPASKAGTKASTSKTTSTRKKTTKS